MRVRKHEYAHRLLVGGEDRVMAAAPIVSEGGMFLGMRGAVKIVAAGDVAVNIATVVNMRAAVVVNNEWTDDGDDADNLWDRTVPKDVAFSPTAGGSQIDVDASVGDDTTTVFSEPGLPNMTVLAQDSHIFAETVLDQSHIMTFADTSDGFKDATPDTFLPNLSLRADTNHRVRVDCENPGYALLALGNPALNQTVITVQNILFGEEYLMLKHLHQLMEDAWKQFAGLDEAGAESPFVDIAALIIEITEPLAQEETANAWGVASYNCWSETWIDTDIPFKSVVPTMLDAG